MRLVRYNYTGLIERFQYLFFLTRAYLFIAHLDDKSALVKYTIIQYTESLPDNIQFQLYAIYNIQIYFNTLVISLKFLQP